MKANFEDLLRRSNEIESFVKDSIEPLDQDTLTWKATGKTWSIVEVIEHLNIVYDKYADNLSAALSSAPEGSTEKMQRSLLGSWSAKMMRPKNNQRKYKMKTFKFFEPQNAQQNVEGTLTDFFKKKEVFNGFIKDARGKNLKGVKVSTALGKRVRFYVPECFDFILAHEERHIQQIKEILEMQKQANARVGNLA